MQFPLGNVDETRDAPTKINRGVEFDGAFTTTKFRPREEFQTEVDGGGVEGVNGFAEGGRERFVRVERSGPTDQDVGEVGEDRLRREYGITPNPQPQSRMYLYLAVSICALVVLAIGIVVFKKRKHPH